MSVIERYAGLILDLDGVVFRGHDPVRGVPGLLRRLRKNDVPVVFVTNNATRTPGEWVEVFEAEKMEVDPGQIVSSAVATADLLADGGHRAFVIGEFGLVSALREAGVEVVDDQEEADTVVVGWDTRLTYDKLRDAATAIHRGCRFLGTNPDTIYPSPEGPWPGNGATLAYLRSATGVAPEVVGKPRTPLLEIAATRLGVDGPVLVVGDQVSTDVTAASNMGWDSALVLSGVDTWVSLIGAAASPTWVVQAAGELDGPEPPVVRPAKEADLSDIRELLRDVGFDESQAARRLSDTLVAEAPGGEVVGTAAWEMVDAAAHLRAITVAESERGHGTGSHLVVRALDELYRREVDWVYLLTPGADEMFLKLGFWKVHRDRVPDEVLETAQFGAESAGATALVRRLRDQARDPVGAA
ncbi:MAG: HAD-IIA family hydrolase [Nitriliruptorales bacterium]|nr:HAD-IIA family hydrolase [Nitriliruptorales bacterium]